jgi:hypothetical protein
MYSVEVQGVGGAIIEAEDFKKALQKFLQCKGIDAKVYLCKENGKPYAKDVNTQGAVAAQIRLADGSDPRLHYFAVVPKVYSGSTNGASYRVQGNVGTLKTTNKPTRDCGIEACPYNAGYKCYSKTCINK